MLWLHLALIIVILSSVPPRKHLQRLVQNAAPHVITRTFPQDVLFLSSNSFAYPASCFHICLQSHTSQSLIFSHTPLLPVLREPAPLLPLLYYYIITVWTLASSAEWPLAVGSQHWSLSLTCIFLSYSFDFKFMMNCLLILWWVQLVFHPYCAFVIVKCSWVLF